MRNFDTIPKERPEPPTNPPAPRMFFRSGIHGGLNVPRRKQKPKHDDLDSHDSEQGVWLRVYVECLIQNKSRNEARRVASEALEDYLEKFRG